MTEEKLFIQKIHLPKLGTSYKTYLNNNGILKECKLGTISNKIVNPKNIWYLLEDLPKYLQESLKDKALTPLEIKEKNKRKPSRLDVYDKEEVLVYVTNDTNLVPIVGNLLPRDGINAYTVITKDNKLILKPIIICWDCHWSDLFSGETKYKKNVFCLASDLEEETREYFYNENLIIKLSEVPDFLEKNKTLKL